MSTIKKIALTASVALAVALTFSCSSGDDDGDSSSSSGGGTSSSDGGGGTSSSSDGGGASSSSDDCVDPSSYEEFKTTTIGEQTWMAENLNYAACGSVCSGNDPANCEIYGRLYDWATASSCNSRDCLDQIQPKHRGVCPSGWHIPTRAEWDILIEYLHEDNGLDAFTGGEGDIAGLKYLKATSGWDSDGDEDKYDFAALPGGHGYSDVFLGNLYYDFGDVNIGGSWWSASKFDSWKYFSAYAEVIYLGTDYDTDAASWNANTEANMFSVRCVKDD